MLGEKCFFGGEKIVTSNSREFDLCLSGGSLSEGEGNGNHRHATFPVSVPGIVPRNYGKSYFPRLNYREVSSRTAISLDFDLFFT